MGIVDLLVLVLFVMNTFVVFFLCKQDEEIEEIREQITKKNKK